MKIYRILLQNEFDDETCYMIDPAPSICETVYHSKGLVCDLLPLLRTCKTVEREASAILYGRSTFIFDDDGDWDSVTRIKPCGITSMHTFLKQIGPTNRMLLDDILISISNFRFCYYTNEVIPGEIARKNGGNYLGDAFDLLSQGHFLSRIAVVLKIEEKPE